jgi:ATP-dependent DNA helicase RecG
MAKTPAQPLLDRILDAARIGENDDWEFKSAKGGFPGSLWETYSAMANSAGGTIVLGATERGATAILDGVTRDQLEKLKKTFWDQHNNRQIISRALVASGDVQDIEVDTGWLLAIRIAPAARKDRPIYKGQNPLDGTYKRRHEGDYRCSPEEVRRMLADADDIPADARILDGFGLDDLDEPSLAAYRNFFAAAKPGHRWLTKSSKEQLEMLGCWRYDRDKGESGLTLAGLLMFGKHQSIIGPGAAPNYLVDFRDYRGRKPKERWGDRLFPDGTWEANLFQFYLRSWPKIVADLKVPFALKGVQRIDDTPVHEALREAVVNAMIHADYKVGGGIVVMRFDDRYQIENPGTLLVSQEQLRRGGVSECHNKSLQRMFMLIGVGEQAGSGFARIQEGWKEQSWRSPRLTEQHGPDRVRLDMPMISLMPQWAFDALRQKIGTSFDRLGQEERIALATAMIEGDVTNTRMQDLVADHPSDITKRLRGLVSKGWLETDNQRRWTRYKLSSSIAPRQDLFSAAAENGGSGSSPLPADSSLLAGNSSPLSSKGQDSLPKGEEWKAAASRVAGKGKVSKDVMEAVILELCSGRFLTLEELASLLDRKPDPLRNKTLTPLVKARKLKFRHPNQPNHPDQAYTTADVVRPET